MFSSWWIIKIDILLAHSVVFMDWRLSLSDILILIRTISHIAVLVIVSFVLLLLRLKIVFRRIVGETSVIQLLPLRLWLSHWRLTMGAKLSVRWRWLVIIVKITLHGSGPFLFLLLISLPLISKLWSGIIFRHLRFQVIIYIRATYSMCAIFKIVVIITIITYSRWLNWLLLFQLLTLSHIFVLRIDAIKILGRLILVIIIRLSFLLLSFTWPRWRMS